MTTHAISPGTGNMYSLQLSHLCVNPLPAHVCVYTHRNTHAKRITPGLSTSSEMRNYVPHTRVSSLIPNKSYSSPKCSV